MLAGQLVGSLPQINWHKQILPPKHEQVLSDAKRSAQIMQRHRLPLTQLLQNRLHLLLRLQLLILKPLPRILLFPLACTPRLHLLHLIYLHLIHIQQLPLKILYQQVQRARPIPSTLCIWVRSHSHNSGAAQAPEGLVLELLGDGPGYQVAGWADASLQAVVDGLLINIALVAHLDSAENVWELTALRLFKVAEENENVVSWRI